MAEQVRVLILDDAEPFSHGGYGGFAFITERDRLGFDAILVDVDGRHGDCTVNKATRVYFVFEGLGQFTIDGEVYDVAAPMLIVMPPGSTYDCEGQLQMFKLNVEPGNDFT